MRCLTLAGELKEKGADVFFITRIMSGDIFNLIERNGFRVYLLPCKEALVDIKKDGSRVNRLGVNWETDAEQTIEFLCREHPIDWLIVDHYVLDHQWEVQMRSFVRKIIVIDDLADRSHDCDFLIDQNLYEGMGTRYEGLIPEYCRKLMGPRYTLLRPEFIKARSNLRERDGNVRRILIFFGGSDLNNETEKALDAVWLLNSHDIVVDVIVGALNPHKEEIERLCSTRPNVNYYCQTENMAEFMVKADLAISAGGSTTWERCCVGLPAIIIAIAENQINISKALSNAGAGIYLGTSKQVTKEMIAQSIANVMKSSEVMINISKRARSLVDGNGVSRVITCMM